MDPYAALPLPQSAFVLALSLVLISPLALAGVALMNAGLGRSRSAAQSMLGTLALISAAVIVFALIGAMFAYGETGYTFTVAGRPWNWIGAGSFALRGFSAETVQTQLSTLFQFIAVAFVVLIAWGSGADRLRVAAGLAAAAILAALVFPMLAYWAWGTGWLTQLGLNFSLGEGFLDPGAATVHVLGGLSALAIVWIAGPRRGKFPKEGLSTAMPGHNAVYVLFGGLLALVGFLAWNMAGALMWADLPPTELVVTAVNTLLEAACALAATFAVTRIRFGKADASLCANGWMAGLVTSTACAAVASPLEALLAGLVAGLITPLLVELLELFLSIDDPSGAITVHGVCGIWGLFAAGLFASQPGQVLAQLIGIAALLGVIFPLVYFLFWAVNLVLPFRVDPDGERIGMDLHELGGSAYPEFVVHRDDSYR
jgi:Amt family ammonium transporter